MLSKLKSWFPFAMAALLVGTFAALKFSGVNLMQAAQGGNALWPLVAAAALLDSFNPCALSVLLLTIGFLFSMGQERKRVLAVGGAYIFGIFLTYVFIGLGVMKTLELFDSPNFMGRVGAWLIIAVGLLDLTNAAFPKFPFKLKIPQASHKYIARLMGKASALAAIALGMFVGMVQFPCVGGPYLLILGMLHDAQTYAGGVVQLVFYNIVFVLPLTAVLFVSANPKLHAKLQEWKSSSTGNMRFATGLAMVSLGAIVLLL